MFKKLSTFILKVLIAGGIFLLFGAMGSADLQRIEFSQLVVRSIIGLALIGAGVGGLYLGGCINEQ